MTPPPEVGSIHQVFKPGLINTAAGIILGASLLGGGIFGLFAATKAVVVNRGNFPPRVPGIPTWDWPGVFIVWVVSTVAIVGGWFVLKWMRSLLSFRVEVGKEGLLIHESSGPRAILWDGIEEVEERQVFLRRKYGLPPQMSLLYIVKPRVGEPFAFEQNSIKEHIMLAGIIKAKTKTRAVPWNITQDRS